MNLQEMMLEVRSALDDDGTTELWSDDEVKRWLNQALRIMCSVAQPLQSHHRFLTVLGQQEYVLPDSVIRIFGVQYNDGIVRTLTPRDTLTAQDGAYATGVPDYFYLRNRTLNTVTHTSTDLAVAPVDPNKPQKAAMVLGLDPIPATSNIPVIVNHFSRHQLLIMPADCPNLPEEFHDGLCAYAIAKGKEKESSYLEANQIFWPRYKDHLTNLKDNYIMDGQDMGFPSVNVDECSDDDDFSPSRFRLYMGQGGTLDN